MTSEPLLQESLEKLEASLAMLFASADSHIPFDPAKAYSPKEREPYDALSDRFLRSVLRGQRVDLVSNLIEERISRHGFILTLSKKFSPT